MRTRVSSRFKLSTQLGVYEGKIHFYKNLMLLQGYFDEVMCEVFSTTVRGLARSWLKKVLRLAKVPSPGINTGVAPLNTTVLDFVALFLALGNNMVSFPF